MPAISEDDSTRDYGHHSRSPRANVSVAVSETIVGDEINNMLDEALDVSPEQVSESVHSTTPPFSIWGSIDMADPTLLNAFISFQQSTTRLNLSQNQGRRRNISVSSDEESSPPKSARYDDAIEKTSGSRDYGMRHAR